MAEAKAPDRSSSHCDLPASPRLWLNRWERSALWTLLTAFLFFGVIVEVRSAFLTRRMTDADCYLRAAWAVRTGQDIYAVTDTNGWHYIYPPLLAILLAPLASAPPNSAQTGMLPYAVSIGLWYAISVGCLWLAVHWLANALGRAAPEPWPRYSRRWWAIRVVPILICILAIGRTLSRGQSNMVILLFLCGMASLAVSKGRFRAGLCLAGAICIKVFPAFLLIYPLARRDLRLLAGTAIGMCLGLVLLPVVVLGPRDTLESYQRYADLVLRPGLQTGADRTVEKELTSATRTDSQSFMAILHNYRFPERSTRPATRGRTVRLIHWSISAIVTTTTLFFGFRRRRDDVISETLFLGALIVIMLPISPIFHSHYLVLALPLIVALVAHAWEGNVFPRFGAGLTTILGAYCILSVVPSLQQGDQWLREMGFLLYATLALWVAGLRALQQRRNGEACGKQRRTEHLSPPK